MEPAELEDREYENALARQQKRRRLLTFAILGVVAVAGALAYLLWPKSEPPRCKADQVSAFLKDQSLPAETVHMACSLPAPLDRCLRESLGVPPTMRALLAFKLVSTNPELFTPACRDFPRALAEALREAPEAQTTRFLSRCDAKGLGFASRGALESAPLARLVLAVAVFQALDRSDPRFAAPLARAICCSGRP